jgi:hypothetical protein
MVRALVTVLATAVLVVAGAPGAGAATATNATKCTVHVTPPAVRTSPFDTTVGVSTQVAAGCAATTSFDLDVLSDIRYYGMAQDGPALAVSLGGYSEHGYPVTRYEDVWYRYGAPAGFYRGWADVVVTFPFPLSRQDSPGEGCRYLDATRVYCSYLSPPTLLPGLN